MFLPKLRNAKHATWTAVLAACLCATSGAATAHDAPPAAARKKGASSAPPADSFRPEDYPFYGRLQRNPAGLYVPQFCERANRHGSSETCENSCEGGIALTEKEVRATDARSALAELSDEDNNALVGYATGSLTAAVTAIVGLKLLKYAPLTRRHWLLAFLKGPRNPRAVPPALRVIFEHFEVSPLTFGGFLAGRRIGLDGYHDLVIVPEKRLDSKIQTLSDKKVVEGEPTELKRAMRTLCQRVLQSRRVPSLRSEAVSTRDSEARNLEDAIHEAQRPQPDSAARAR